MDTSTKFGHYLENLGNPFIVGSLVTEKTFYVNKQMSELFGVSTEDCDLGKIFDKSPEQIQALMVKSLKNNKPTLQYNYTAITKENKQILVDLQVGYFNDEKTEVFLEIIPQIDRRMELALHQIQNSPRAEAILNLDEKLSIVDCNEAFLKVFEASEELRHSHFKNDLVNGFLPEVRESLMTDIHSTLETREIFSTEIKVFTATGEEKWYQFDLQKRELDNSGMKLMCYMVNIEKQIEVKENFDLVNQYLSAVQETTVDLLYRVDIATNTMYTYYEFQNVVGNDREIHDYVNTFFDKNTIHPEDKEIYLKGFRDFYENDIPCATPIRFSIEGRPYRWYKITGKKIFDNKGNLTEVFGTLVNVDNEVNMQEEVSSLNQYFEALQSISGESFYSVDVRNKTLSQQGQVAEELGFFDVVQNFPESVLHKVYPDDLELYKTFTYNSMKGIAGETRVRVLTAQGVFQWYEILCQIIRDETGGVSEVVGKMNNIHKEMTMQEEVSSLNQYLEALQSISGESFYSIDVKNKTLTQKGQVAEELGLFDVIENFPECLLYRVYPEDLELYKTYTYNSMKGIAGETRVRVQTPQGDYQWYEILCQIIRDETGAVSEVVGKMNNIHKEMTMEEKVSTLYKYFNVLNDLTDESLYFYDIKTNKLRLGGLMEKELGLPPELDNYPESAYEYIHPDDLEMFKKFDGRTLDSGQNRQEVRLKNVDGQYQWYELLSEIICDDAGNQTEIFGRIKNVQSKHKLETAIEEANNYLLVMQELSDDILYRIDVEAQTLVYTTKSKSGEILTNTFENYPQSTFDKHLMHPEDEKIILEQTDQWLSGNMIRYKLRMKLITEDYEWYQDSAINIRDKEGNVTEIYGRLKNIHNETLMKEEVAEANQELSVMNQYFSAMQTLSGESLYNVNLETRELRIQGEIAQELGLKSVQADYPACVIDLVHPDEMDTYKEFSKRTLSGYDCELKLRVRNTKEIYQWYSLTSRIIRDDTEKAIEILGRIKNIHAEETMVADFSVLNQYFTAMQNLSQNILFHIDVKTKTFKHADTNAQSFGVPVEIPNFADNFIENGFVRPEDAEKYREYTEKLMSGENMEYEIQAAVGVGVYEWFHITSQFIFNDKGEPVEIFGMMENIQDKKDLEQKASHDLMTKVLNKVSFEEEAEDIMLKLRPDNKHALIFIDLDDFKGVNDKLGHSYGDVLLTTVGKRLKRHVREGDLVGRIGGDEFAVMLCNIGEEQSVLDRTNMMLESVKRNFSHEGISVGIKASVGVAIYPQHGTTYKDLIGKSDIAVYESKRRGKNVVSMYSEELEEY